MIDFDPYLGNEHDHDYEKPHFNAHQISSQYVSTLVTDIRDIDNKVGETSGRSSRSKQVSQEQGLQARENGNQNNRGRGNENQRGQQHQLSQGNQNQQGQDGSQQRQVEQRDALRISLYLKKWVASR